MSGQQSEVLVELRDVRFAYGERQILRGVDLSVRAGQVVAIMGGSGSGKTTLLRLIGGQLRAGGAFPLREHTDLPNALIRDLVLMKLQAVGLRGAYDRMPAELSGGMARRVALARAVALDPMLIMYDEPFAGLDPISLGIVGQLVRRLNDALGAASILVTHDVHESLEIVDYVYFVSDGRIVAQGTPEEIRASKDPFVYQFVNAEADGPVPFHVAAEPIEKDFLMADAS